MTPQASPTAQIRSTGRYQLAASSALLVLLGSFGPWQKTLFGLSANGLEVGAVLLVPALALAGYAIAQYHAGAIERRKRIGWLLVTAGLLVVYVELANLGRLGALIVLGWGAVLAGVGAIGLLCAGIWLLRTTNLLDHQT